MDDYLHYRLLWMLVPFWLWMAVKSPVAWAVVTALGFVVLTGFVTARVILDVDGFRRTLWWSSVFGLGWMSLFWGLFKVLG